LDRLLIIFLKYLTPKLFGNYFMHLSGQDPKLI
jgi:hypothetical protein